MERSAAEWNIVISERMFGYTCITTCGVLRWLRLLIGVYCSFIHPVDYGHQYVEMSVMEWVTEGLNTY